MSFQILGTGSFLPEKVITNEELSRMVNTSDEWITKRVGVKERHVCRRRPGPGVRRGKRFGTGPYPRRLCQRGQHLPRYGKHGAE